MSESNTNVIQVSTQKSINYYANLSKKFLSANDEIELSGLGTAIYIVVSAAELLKQQGFGVVTSINISSIPSNNEARRSLKPKIFIKVKKSENFEKLYEADQQQQQQQSSEKKETSE